MPPVAALAATVSMADSVPNTSGAPPAPQYPPVTSTAVSGAQAQRTYRVALTYSNAGGESSGSPEMLQLIPANSVLTVVGPSGLGLDSPGSPTGYNVYAGTGAAGTETKQNGSTPIALGVAWQEPASGLVGGTSLPTTQPQPAYTNATSTVVNTPPAAAAISVPHSPSGAVVTNTGRSLSAHATYLATLPYKNFSPPLNPYVPPK